MYASSSGRLLLCWNALLMSLISYFSLSEKIPSTHAAIEIHEEVFYLSFNLLWNNILMQ